MLRALFTFCCLTIVFFANSAQAYDSPRAEVFYRYIRDVYYAKNLKQVADYWTQANSTPFKDMMGDQATEQLKKIKRGYIANPRITSERQQGEQWIMSGTGIAADNGTTIPAKLNLVMRFENGRWRIQYYAWSGLRQVNFR